MRHAGFAALVSGNGEDALAIATAKQPDLVVLDLRLPRMDGFEVAKRLRRAFTVPIIMLTARVEEADRIRGLEIGADDYITKPFSPRELVARVRAVLRRTNAARPADDALRIGDLTLELPRMTTTVSGQAVDLTSWHPE